MLEGMSLLQCDHGRHRRWMGDTSPLLHGFFLEHAESSYVQRIVVHGCVGIFIWLCGHCHKRIDLCCTLPLTAV